jgi:hypothetical protein
MRRFDAYSMCCGERCQAACTTYSRLSMSPSTYLCVGDIRAIVQDNVSSSSERNHFGMKFGIFLLSCDDTLFSSITFRKYRGVANILHEIVVLFFSKQ